MPTKKIFVALLIIVVAIGGFVAGLILLRQRQDLADEAAVQGGQAEVSIDPETGTYSVGDTIKVSVYFNPANIPISTVGVRLTYPFSGTNPEVTVSSIEINPLFLSDADWSCPSPEEPDIQGGNVIIEIACGTIGAAGFTTNNDTLLANINLYVERTPAAEVLVVRFDPYESTIKRKSNGEDILLVPTSTGSYTVGGGGQATATPSPTGTLPTGTLTVTPTGTLTVTPTATATSTLTPTTADQLPDAGISYPTFLGIGAGLFVIFAALILAL